MGAGAIPDEFVCPISGDVMRDPVWLSTGIAVDRVFAEYYLQAGFTTCPITGEQIKDSRLVPVPNMAEYIAKWGRRVGFDLNAEPSEGQKTHAIIQAAERAGRTTRDKSSLPRATPAELEEAWAQSGLSQPGSPMSPTTAAAQAATERSEAEDKAAAESAATNGAANGGIPQSNDLSLTLKGYAAANAVHTPDEDVDSPVADPDERYDEGEEAGAGGVRVIKGPGGVPPGYEGRKGYGGSGLFTKVFGSKANRQQSSGPSAVARAVGAKSRGNSPLPSPRDGSRYATPEDSPGRREAAASNYSAAPATVGVAGLTLDKDGQDAGSEPSSRRVSPEGSPEPSPRNGAPNDEDLGPTVEATRAAAAWTPPPASKVSAESVTRGKRSASSYAAYSSDDHAAFASQLDQSGGDGAGGLRRDSEQSQGSRRNSAVQRRRASYAPYSGSASGSQADVRSMSEGPQGGDGSSLMEEVMARNEEVRPPSPDPHSKGRRSDMGSPQPTSQDPNLSWLMTGKSANGANGAAAGTKLPTLRPAGQPGTSIAGPSPPLSQTQPQQTSVFGHRYDEPGPDVAYRTAPGADVPGLDTAATVAAEARSVGRRSGGSDGSDPGRLVGRNLDGTLQPTITPPTKSQQSSPNLQTSAPTQPETTGPTGMFARAGDSGVAVVRPVTMVGYGGGLAQPQSSLVRQRSMSGPQPGPTSYQQPAAPPQATQLTAGGMPMPQQSAGGRVRRLSRRLSGTFKDLFGSGNKNPPPDADQIIPPQDMEVVPRQAVPSDSRKSNSGINAAAAAAAAGASSYASDTSAPTADKLQASDKKDSGGFRGWLSRRSSKDNERKSNRDLGRSGSNRDLGPASRNDSLASEDLAAAAAAVEQQLAGSGGSMDLRPSQMGPQPVGILMAADGTPSPMAGQPLSSPPSQSRTRPTEDLTAAAERTLDRLNSPGGGVSPGERALRGVSVSSTGSGAGGATSDYAQMTQSLRARQGDVSETMSEASIEASSRIGGADYAPAPGRARTSSYASEVEMPQAMSPEMQAYQQAQLLQQQQAAQAAAQPKGLFGRRLQRRASNSGQSLVSLNSIGRAPSAADEYGAGAGGSPGPQLLRSQSGSSHQRMADQQEVAAIVAKMREVRDPRGQALLPVLARLAALTDENDEMRSYFIATGGAPRLTQLTESTYPPLKTASARVVWHLARNPVVAMELMRAGVVPALYTVFKSNPADPMPFIGALVHFNCHNQELAPFTADQIRAFIEALLIAGASAEDALAASFCLLRIYEAGKPPAGEVLRLLAGAGGGVQALVAMMGLQFCSGSEAAARLLGALSQNISGMAARIAHHGGVQGLAQLLDCPVASGRTAAAQALAKVVAAAPAARTLVNMVEVTAPLFDMLRAGDAAGAEAAAWLLGYCATDPASRRHLTDCGAASALMPALAGSVGAGAREGAAWAADQISQEVGGAEPFAAAGACPALLGLVRTGKQLGRDSALRLLAAIARSSETDGVTLVGAAGLKAVLPLLTQRPEEGNRAAREAAMEVVRVMCTQHGNPRKQNIDLSVHSGSVKAVVAIAKAGSQQGRDAAAAALAELSASGSKAAMTALRKEKAVAALIPIMIGGSVGGREAAAVALANLAAGNKDTAAEIVKAHGLVGLNQLLLSGTPSGKAAGAALVARLAPSPAFARTDARGPLLVSLAAAVAQPSAATRVAAAEALAAMGDGNAANKMVVAKAAPGLLQMLRTPDLPQVDAAALALATMAKSSHLLATERAGLAETAASLRAAGVVGPRTIAALDAIIAACRSAGPGRASRGASYADYGAASAPSGYTTQARRTSYADYGSGMASGPFGGAPMPSGSSLSPYQAPGVAAGGAPPWAQAASYADADQISPVSPAGGPPPRRMSYGPGSGGSGSYAEYAPPPQQSSNASPLGYSGYSGAQPGQSQSRGWGQ